MKITAVLLLLAAARFGRAGTLEDDFRNPPMSARPYVWWHWMGANFSMDGITKDLEAMKASGIGGATIFNLSSAVQESQAPIGNLPWTDQTYRSPKYWAALRHAAAEADRLGLELGLENSVGYSCTGGPWIDEARSMQRLVWTGAAISGGTLVVTNLAAPKFVAEEGWGPVGRALAYFQDIAVLAVPADRANLSLAEVLDLTRDFSPDGTLRWNAPAGRWMVYRLAHASTGHPPQPPPDDLLGKILEVDKLSLAQTKFHWANVINPVKANLGPWFGKSFRFFGLDSYEAGNQNWTGNFRAEFKRRKGYDPLPWLVTMGTMVHNGSPTAPERTLGGAEQTERFEWDYRDVISTLFLENGWEPAAKLLHAAGVKFQWEPYDGPFDTVAGATVPDLPMVEFWSGSAGHADPRVVASARAAGKTIIGAEAFTGAPNVSPWTETPAFLKAAGDAQFASGVNRLVLHHWVHQPFDDRYQPGMGMGWWGTHFGRNQTWAELGKEFYRYLGRCQALLQRGETPADYLSVGTPQGDGDVIPPRDLKRVRVAAGKIVLPSGRQYAFLSFPHGGAMLPETLAHVKRLLNQGATVVCARPTQSPSLANYPQCDEQVKQFADEIWDQPSRQLFSDINAAIKARGITPRAEIVRGKAGDLRIQPRRDGEAEWFFVANLDRKPARCTASFHTTGRQPELWNAETGTIELAPEWRARDGRTEVDLKLEGEKSVFVVFRDHPTAVKPAAYKPLPALPLAGPWTLGIAGKNLALDHLASWTEQADADVKYFSGTATYRTTFKLAATPRRMDLELGDVRDLVRVRVNGQDLGVWWHPPFAREITAALQPGENVLELEVCNTWHNRLVGDEQFPADFEWGADRGADRGRAMKAFPEWFIRNEPRGQPGRKGFVIWYYERKDTPLIPAGLLGPVQLVPMVPGAVDEPVLDGRTSAL